MTGFLYLVILIWLLCIIPEVVILGFVILIFGAIFGPIAVLLIAVCYAVYCTGSICEWWP